MRISSSMSSDMRDLLRFQRTNPLPLGAVAPRPDCFRPQPERCCAVSLARRVDARRYAPFLAKLAKSARAAPERANFHQHDGRDSVAIMIGSGSKYVTRSLALPSS